MEKPFTEAQKEALREALRWYRTDSFHSKKLSWAAIAESINESQGSDINPKYLSKFVDGLPQKGSSKQKKTSRIYQSSLPNNGLGHIANFLSDPDEAKHIFNVKSFEEEGKYFPWPPSLTNYLTFSKTPHLHIDFALLHGAYKLCWNQETMTLLLVPSQFKNILRFKIFYGCIDIRAISLPVFQVSGWAILTTSDNLLFFGREMHKNETVCFTTLAYDNRLRQGKPPQRLLLRKSTMPIDTQTLDKEGEIPKELITSIQDDVCTIWDARLLKSFSSQV